MLATKACFILLFLCGLTGNITANSFSEIKDEFDLDSVKIYYFFGPYFEDHKEYDLDEAALILQNPMFIHNQTTCYIPGYNNHKFQNGTRIIIDAYLKANSTNILYLDWEKLSSGDYTSGQENVFKLSPRVAHFIIDLFNNGLDEESFSMVGHSMGGRALAVIAQNVIEQSHGTMMLSRISALDPSNEEAHDPFILPEIQKSHAKFVDLIHTDAGEKGTTKSMGHANFWPNNGTPIQPGCTEDDDPICSHYKSVVYWAESVKKYRGSSSFLGYPSGSYEELIKNGVEKYKNGAELMGVDCDPSARGDFYLQYIGELSQYYDIAVNK